MKVLIISHNPVSNQSNMGKTFCSLFSGFDKEALCQIYIYPTIPDVDRCGSYYRVTDKEALRFLLFGGTLGGEIDKERISPEQGQFEAPRDRTVYRHPGNKSPVRRLLRDRLWTRAPWYSDELKAWLARQKPDCIFVAPGAAAFPYDCALLLGRELGIPVVTYLCDEFYFLGEPKGRLDRLRLKRLQGKMEELLEASAHLVVISRELADAYRAKFPVASTVLMTGAGIPAAIAPRLTENPSTLCYFGNVRCNRFRSLAEIGRTLDAINRETGTCWRLKIYTAEQDKSILNSLRRGKSVELAGYVTGAEYTGALTESELLLHVEAFDGKSMERVKHSVSTKIADYLASGVPVVAYGPEEIASMAHLRRWDCAMAATAPERLRETLLRAFTDPGERRRVAENGLRAARECHDEKTVSDTLGDILGYC